MTSEQVMAELKQLEKNYWDDVERITTNVFFCGPTDQIPTGVLIKKLTDEYYAEKDRLEILLAELSGGGTA